MFELDTIQKFKKLNTVSSLCDVNDIDQSDYSIEMNLESGDVNIGFNLHFQKGPRKDESSRHGLMNEDLLEIVRHRLKSFQKGDLSCQENDLAITHIENALLWLNKRNEDRMARGVLGTYNK